MERIPSTFRVALYAALFAIPFVLVAVAQIRFVPREIEPEDIPSLIRSNLACGRSCRVTHIQLDTTSMVVSVVSPYDPAQVDDYEIDGHGRTQLRTTHLVGAERHFDMHGVSWTTLRAIRKERGRQFAQTDTSFIEIGRCPEDREGTCVELVGYTMHGKSTQTYDARTGALLYSR